jgi:hypothetical protein
MASAGRKHKKRHTRQRGGKRSRATRKADHKSTQPGPGPSQCHPSMGSVAPPQGCLPIEILRTVAAKLDLGPETDPADLRKQLEEKLELDKPGERSFLNGLPIPEHEKGILAKKYLRPPLPNAWTEDPDMWLDSNNIADVMNQYEVARTKGGKKEFEFMGPFPIDFAAPDPYNKGEKKCLQKEICEIRVEKALTNGIKSIGIVYNLDPHYKSGSHWVANYIDIPGNTCYYFDSYGMEPPPQVATFMKWLSSHNPSNPMKLQYNKRRLQYSNTECGMYCIYMITRMLEGDSFLDITRRKPKDSDMLDFRDWMFST